MMTTAMIVGRTLVSLGGWEPESMLAGFKRDADSNRFSTLRLVAVCFR